MSDRKKRAFVYIAECGDGTWYTGWTTDPVSRLQAHNNGKGAKYTRSRLPLRLVYQEEFPGKIEAMRCEYRIKKMTRKEKEQYVREHKNGSGI